MTLGDILLSLLVLVIAAPIVSLLYLLVYILWQEVRRLF